MKRCISANISPTELLQGYRYFYNKKNNIENIAKFLLTPCKLLIYQANTSLKPRSSHHPPSPSTSDMSLHSDRWVLSLVRSVTKGQSSIVSNRVTDRSATPRSIRAVERRGARPARPVPANHSRSVPLVRSVAQSDSAAAPRRQSALSFPVVGELSRYFPQRLATPRSIMSLTPSDENGVKQEQQLQRATLPELYRVQRDTTERQRIREGTPPPGSGPALKLEPEPESSENSNDFQPLMAEQSDLDPAFKVGSRDGSDESADEEQEQDGRKRRVPFLEQAVEQALCEWFADHPMFYDSADPNFKNRKMKERLLSRMGRELSMSGKCFLYLPYPAPETPPPHYS